MVVILLVFIFGTIIGSFLNVVILRYNTGKNIFGPKERSICFSCAKKLEWYELVPVFSFFFLRAKCSACKSPISWQYPLVEIATGLVFVGIFVQNFSATNFSAIVTVLYAAIWSLLIVITVYDFRHKIIPDGLVYTFASLSLISAFLTGSGGGFLGSILAGVVFFAFFAGLWLVSGGRWLGFGDAKLVLGVGFLLGFFGGLSALALAFWIGAVVSIFLLSLSWLGKELNKRLVDKKDKKVVQSSGLRGRLFTLTMKSEIPFAPFIILGTLIVFFCSIDIFGTARLLFTI